MKMKPPTRIIAFAVPIFAFFLGLAAPSKAVAESAKAVSFTNHPNTFTANVGQPFSIPDLKALLSSLGSGNLRWSAPQIPSWLTLNTSGSTISITGTPTAANLGPNSFTLFVTETGSETGDNSEMIVNVVTPITWANPTINLGIQNQGSAMTPFDLKTQITAPAGGAGLTFTSTNLPSWMRLSSDGMVTGTPTATDVGAYSGIVFVATAAAGNSAQATGYGKVLPKPPTWVSNPISLGDTPEESPFTANLVQYVLNTTGGTLNFTLVSVPAWLQIDSSGNLYGTPPNSNLGANRATVMFTTTVDGSTFSDTTTFNINVLHVNHAPVWTANPINLPAANSRVAYSQSLANSATDPDTGDTLTFALVSGPAWARVSAAGVISGTPADTDVSAQPNSWQVKVTDQGGLSATTTVNVIVNKTPYPPTWLVKPTVLPNANEDASYMANLNSYVSNPDGIPLTFTVMSGPTWATVSGSGILGGTAHKADLPLSTFSIKVSNSVGSDVSNVIVPITHTNHPPQWLLNPISVSVQQKQPMNVNISGYAMDPDQGDTLAFQLISGPAWAQLSASGIFTGTPQLANVGANTYVVRVLDQAGLYADATVTINVLHVNSPPVWSQNPIVLANAPEQTAYSASVASYASDPDSDTLTFAKVSGPAWVMVATDGTITGTPPHSAIGLNSFQVSVSDPSHEFVVTTVQVTVTKVNHPPIWLQNPILMANGYDNQAYSFNIATYATDPDGNPMTFSLVSGPAWMSVSAAGLVTGRPQKADDGAFTAVFAVNDGNFAVNANGNGTVIHVKTAPVVAAIPDITMKERESKQITLTTWVTDADGDTLTFTMANAPSWVTAFSNGNVTLAPLHPQIGTNVLNFTASNGSLTSNGSFKVIVIPDPRPPVWLNDPINMTAKTNVAFTGTLNGQSKDLDGLAVTYSKVSGNAWLNVAANGDLTGTPKDADLGTDTFTVKSCNTANLCTTAQLIITVKLGIVIDTTQVDKPVPGAPAENLWVIDTSKHCSRLIASLKKEIGYYYELLNQAQLHHTGVYLSANAHKWDGAPVSGQAGNKLLTWNEADITSDFIDRIDGSKRNEETEKCHNCLNSPIWSMFRFYEQVSGFADIYHHGYFMPSVPMDAMIVTQQRDHYNYYSHKTQQKNWTPSDYASSFIATHTAENKPYRISAIAPNCPRLYSEFPNDAAPENAYKTLANKTNGQYYTVGSCGFDLHPFLEDYAKSVIFRAYVYAKTSFPLSQRPMDITTITVSIGGVPLQSSQWRYDPTVGTNGAVIINWTNIDIGQIKPVTKWKSNTAFLNFYSERDGSLRTGLPFFFCPLTTGICMRSGTPFPTQFTSLHQATNCLLWSAGEYPKKGESF